jgi:hypothetical protein
MTAMPPPVVSTVLSAVVPALAPAGFLRDLLADHGLVLLGGVSAFLAAGVVAIRLQRSPLHRQRLGELTILCSLVWLVLACVPLPRLASTWWDRAEATPAGAPTGNTPKPRPLFLPQAPRPTDASRDPEFASLLATVTSRQMPETVLTTTAFAPRPSPARQTLRASLPAAYLVGTAACAGWLLVGHVLLWRMLRRSARPAPWLRELFESLQDDLSPGHLSRRRPPRLRISTECGRPVSCGVFRPTVLLPAACAAPANAAQLRHVLLHELAHVRQRDAIGNALLNLAMPLLYFHPLYWLVRSDVHLARELVADDWAARRTGKSSYVTELVSLARSRLPSTAAGRLAGVGLFLFGSPTHFYRRMYMLMHRRESLPTCCSAPWQLGTVTACALAVGIGVALGGARPARAQSEDGPKSAEAHSIRPVVPVVERANAVEGSRAVANLEARKASVMQRMTELLGQAAKARDEQKAKDEQVYRVQLKKAEAELAALKQELDQTTPDGAGPGPGPEAERERALKAERQAMEAALRARDEQLAVSQKMLQDLASRSKEAEVARAEADSLRSQLANLTARLNAQQNRVQSSQQGLAQNQAELFELRNREAKIGRDLAQVKSDRDSLKAIDAEKRDAEKREAAIRSFNAANTGRTAYTPLPDGADSGTDPAERGASRLSAGSLDLVALATSYADAVGSVRVARYRVKAAAEKDQEAEVQIQQASLETAEHKAGLLRSIAEIAMAGAEAEYKRTRELAGQGVVSKSTLEEAESKLKILQTILKSDGQSSSAQPKGANPSSTAQPKGANPAGRE